MLAYCQQDIILNSRVYDYLLIEGKDFSDESIQLEHGVSCILKQQEDNGFLFDLKKNYKKRTPFYAKYHMGL